MLTALYAQDHEDFTFLAVSPGVSVANLFAGTISDLAAVAENRSWKPKCGPPC